MGGFFNLKPSLIEQRKTGDAILKLCRSVGVNTPDSEWVKFKADPKGWLHRAGYSYVGPGAGPNGEIPASITVVPVYDTAETMHVRIPFKGDLDPVPVIQDEPTYGTPGPNRFPILLARYFMRKCR